MNGAKSTAEVGSDGGGMQTLMTGEQDLATADGEGVAGTQTGAKLTVFGAAQGTNKDWCFHTFIITSNRMSVAFALAVSAKDTTVLLVDIGKVTR